MNKVIHSPPVDRKCTHYQCRCARATELMAIYDRTGNGRWLHEAIAVHEQEVVCIFVPVHTNSA